MFMSNECDNRNMTLWNSDICRIMSWRWFSEARRAALWGPKAGRKRSGLFGEGERAPSTPAGGSGEALYCFTCRVWRRAPATQRFSDILSALDGVSVLVANGGYDPHWKNSPFVPPLVWNPRVVVQMSLRYDWEVDGNYVCWRRALTEAVQSTVVERQTEFNWCHASRSNARLQLL